MKERIAVMITSRSLTLSPSRLLGRSRWAHPNLRLSSGIPDQNGVAIRQGETALTRTAGGKDRSREEQLYHAPDDCSISTYPGERWEKYLNKLARAQRTFNLQRHMLGYLDDEHDLSVVGTLRYRAVVSFLRVGRRASAWTWSRRPLRAGLHRPPDRGEPEPRTQANRRAPRLDRGRGLERCRHQRCQAS
jgi:hypothetical protein